MAQLERTLGSLDVIEGWCMKGWYMSVGRFQCGEVNTGFLFITLKEKNKRLLNPSTRKRWT